MPIDEQLLRRAMEVIHGDPLYRGNLGTMVYDMQLWLSEHTTEFSVTHLTDHLEGEQSQRWWKVHGILPGHVCEVWEEELCDGLAFVVAWVSEQERVVSGETEGGA
jgi:hypothetical protein